MKSSDLHGVVNSDLVNDPKGDLYKEYFIIHDYSDHIFLASAKMAQSMWLLIPERRKKQSNPKW